MVTKIRIGLDEHPSLSYNSKNYTSKIVDKIKGLLAIIRLDVTIIKLQTH